MHQQHRPQARGRRAVTRVGRPLGSGPPADGRQSTEGDLHAGPEEP